MILRLDNLVQKSGSQRKKKRLSSVSRQSKQQDESNVSLKMLEGNELSIWMGPSFSKQSIIGIKVLQ